MSDGCCPSLSALLRMLGFADDGYVPLDEQDEPFVASDAQTSSEPHDSDLSAPHARRHSNAQALSDAAAAALRAHVEQMMRSAVGVNAEFSYLESRQAESYRPDNFRSARAPRNQLKNRYTDILPHENTRVLLSGPNDYINANFLDGNVPKRYISTQGPLERTSADFWQMVWEQNSHIIVMLTREVEHGSIAKCARYWPPTGATRCYGSVWVTACGVEQHESGQVLLHRFRIRRGPRALAATRGPGMREPTQEAEREILHYQFIGWPDHGVPRPSAPFLVLLREVARAERKWLTADPCATLPPLIIHCSAGIGRSGTFICVHAVIERHLATLNSNDDSVEPLSEAIVKRIQRMREQRVGMVQTREQFLFCYVAVMEGIERLAVQDQTNDAFSLVDTIARLALDGYPSGDDLSVGQQFEAAEDLVLDESDTDEDEFDDDL